MNGTSDFPEAMTRVGKSRLQTIELKVNLSPGYIGSGCCFPFKIRNSSLELQKVQETK